MQVEGQQGSSLLDSLATGARVSNTYPTCLEFRDSPLKGGLIPDVAVRRHRLSVKDSSAHDGDASD